jgi:hypothetical protein
MLPPVNKVPTVPRFSDGYHSRMFSIIFRLVPFLGNLLESYNKLMLEPSFHAYSDSVNSMRVQIIRVAASQSL